MIAIGSQDIKVHFCTNQILADQVCKNLVKRGIKNPESRYVKTDNVVTWYSGAPMWGTEYYSFELPNLTIKCGEFDLSYLVSAVKRLSSEKYDNNFYKLHGLYNIICLDHYQYFELKKCIINGVLKPSK